MAVKIRLQRHGKKGQPFYHIVIADARAARDGKFIENIGTYNPLTSPATIVVDVDKACKWLKDGAQPTDTVRSLFSYKGIMLKRHLQIGVEKGAMTQEVADQKLNAWLDEKNKKIAAKIEKAKNDKNAKQTEAFKKENEVNQKRLEAIAKKKADMEEAAKKKAEEEAKAKEAKEEQAAEVKVEDAPKAEETQEETK
jgi:small subunit ribosomal protein S16